MVMEQQDLKLIDTQKTEESHTHSDQIKVEQNTAHETNQVNMTDEAKTMEGSLMVATLPRVLTAPLWYTSLVGEGSSHHAPLLSPSFSNYVRGELTRHVTGWPTDKLEQQANKFAREAYLLGCVQCSRVSTELKSYRSLMRHKDVEALVQEQKMIYLRQEISRLEEYKINNWSMRKD